MERASTERAGTRAILLWVVGFLAVVIVGDRALGALGESLLLRSQQRFSTLYRGGLEADIVVIGNSRAVNAFYAPVMEEELGWATFNASFNGVSSEIGEAILEDYYERNSAPSFLIVEVSGVFSNPRQLHDLKPFMPVSPSLGQLTRTYFPDVYWSCRVSRVYCLNSLLFLRSLSYLRRGDQDWINRHRIRDDAVEAIVGSAPDSLAPPRESNVEALGRIVSDARARGAQVRLVLAPYLPEYRVQLGNLERWRAGLEAELGEPVWDFSGAVSERAAFSDHLHLNQRGARILLEQMRASEFFGERK